MTTPDPTTSDWTDGDLLAIAWFATASFGSMTERLAQSGVEHDLGAVTEVLARLAEAGFVADAFTPRDLRVPERLRADVESLRDQVARVRAAVAATFTGPGALGERIWATTLWPRVHLALASALDAGPEEAQIVSLGDLPPTSADLIHRSELAGLTGLRSLGLYACGLSGRELGLTLETLPALASLDLSDNDLEVMPRELADAVALEELHLDGNPLAEVGLLLDPDVLPALAYVDLGQTDITDATLRKVRSARPALVVDR